MHNGSLADWEHDHTFAQDLRQPGETRTRIVILLTATTMTVEVLAGIHYGSMALLADGLHMASHACALGISAFAYAYARRHARDRDFSFGTGKVNALGGFTGAVLLAVFALYMAFESILRMFTPVGIEFDQAIAVAFLGLIVNGASVFILGSDGHDHAHGHDHHGHHPDGSDPHHHDHNLTSAYLHVLADALTSVLAIFALLCAKYFGWVWMDPAMGVVGSVLVARWSYGLLRDTASVLLDRQAPQGVQEGIRAAVEADGDSRVTDLHVWSIGPGLHSAQITVVAHQPADPRAYKERLPHAARLVHVSVEIHRCTHGRTTG